MTSPDGPFVPPPLSPAAHAAARDAARAGLLGARADVEDAASRARRSLHIGWESPAAGRFRAEAAVLLRQIDRDLDVLDEAVAVLPR
jgi:hypothetical protein